MSKQLNANQNQKLTVETEETGVVYKITNTVNNKLYIGQADSYIQYYGKIIRHGGNRRWKEHIDKAIKSGTKGRFYDAIREHGADKFEHVDLEIVKLNDLDYKETFYINKYDTTNKDIGYNVIDTGVPRLSKEKNTKRIQKIKDTMKDKWKDDPEYAEKTKKANFKAVVARTNSGQTRQKDKDLNLPGNIYKTDKGYDIRIMRGKDYKITCVEDSSLTDEQKLAKAIKRKEEILYNIKHGIDDSFEKRKDHNGKDLPQNIVKHTARGNPGYKIQFRHNKKRVERCFTDKRLTMDEKLEKAKKALAELVKDKDAAVNNPQGRKKSLDHNGNELPPGLIYLKMKNGNLGYMVACKGVKRKEFGSQRVTKDELLENAKKYLEENKPN